MTKRIQTGLLFLLSIFALVIIIPKQTVEAENMLASGQCGTDLTWSLDVNGTLTVNGTGIMDYYDDDEYNDYDPEGYELAPWYSHRLSVKKVFLTEGVTSIYSHAFEDCNNLDAVELPDSLRRIGENAFAACGKLTRLIIPDSVEWIGKEAFFGCVELQELKLGQSLRWIGDEAFYSCRSLESFYLPAAVSFVGENFLAECRGIKEISAAEDSASFSSLDGVLFNKDQSVLIRFPNGKTETVYAHRLGELIGKEQPVRSYTIPKGVTRINSGAFSGCEGLWKVVFPDGLLQIGAEAFLNCGLREIDLPDGLRDIGESAFASCPLRVIDIPDGISTLEYGAFDLSGVTAIGIPASVGWIEDCAFSTGTLKDIYYDGSEEHWKTLEENAEIYRGFYLNPNYAKVHYESKLPEWMKHAPISQTGVARFRSDINNGKNITGRYSYDESWFLKDSTEYQHGLVKMSLIGAVTAFNALPSSDTESADRNIVKLMEDLRFTNIITDYPVPSSDSIGFAIGSKNITAESGEEFSLIMVTVRGGGYADEWQGNFRVGLDEEHEGFRLAADVVENGICRYFEDYSDQLFQSKKIWIMGYSRAAAVTNLTAKGLIVHDSVGIPYEDIYAFCFECPATTTAEDKDSCRFSNIVNIVNPIDFVTKVPLSAWGFGRYGRTYYLPYREGVSIVKYIKQEKAMRAAYLELYRYNFGGKAPKLIPNTLGQTVVLDQLFFILSGLIKNQNDYMSIQPFMMDKIGGALSGDSELSIGNKVDLIREVLYDLANSGYALFPLERLASIIEDVMLAHYPELCMSWLNSLSGEIDYADGKYNLIYVNCPVDVSVYNENGDLIGQIMDDEVRAADDCASVFIDQDGQKVVALPVEGVYQLILSASDDGAVTYTAMTCDAEGTGVERLVSYYEIPVAAGDELIAGVDQTESSEAETFSLTKDGVTLSASLDLRGEEVQRYLVTAETEGDGMVNGGGAYFAGEFAKLTAEASEGAIFIGWYEGETLVSDMAEFRFLVEGDRNMTARFARYIPGDVNKDGRISIEDAILLFKNISKQDKDEGMSAPDVDEDGKLTNRDAIALFRKAAGADE